eukprot:TRINITY_DN29_c0_g1_i1.p1 TRINITY_DN29_c0_g1~~TRINITY_DN29_c0_g1_i1.p1  ORF type:complete len:746 (-),score=298.39 TRINITY_DN29_c0_g1_i1:1088-3325(-)
MKQSVIGRIAILLLLALAAQEGVNAYDKVVVGKTHMAWSGIASTLHRAQHMMDKLHGKGVPADLPRDNMGNVLLQFPDPETNEHSELKADLNDEANQDKLDEYLDNLLADHTGLEEEEDELITSSSLASGPPHRRRFRRRYKNDEKWFAGEMDRLNRGEQKEAKAAIKDAGSEFGAIAKSGESLDAKDVVIAIIFGFVNGVFMGMGDVFRDNIRAMRTDPTCQQPLQRIKNVLESMRDSPKLMKGIFGKRKDRGGMSRWKFLKSWGKRTLEDLGELIAAVWNLAKTCESTKRILRPLFKLLAIGAVFTLLMYAFPAFGWLIKFAGMIITFIFSLKFLWKTVKKFFAARRVCKSNGKCTRQAKIDKIEAVCEILGWLYTLFMMASSQDWKKIKNEFNKFKQSKLGQKLGLKPDKSMQQSVERLDSALKASRRGDRANVEELSSELGAEGTGQGPPGQNGGNGPPGGNNGGTSTGGGPPSGGNGGTGGTSTGGGPPGGNTGGTSTGGGPPSNGYGTTTNTQTGTSTGTGGPPANGYGTHTGTHMGANGGGWIPPVVVDKDKKKEPTGNPTTTTNPNPTKPPNPFIPDEPAPPEITVMWMSIIHFEFDKDCIGCANEPHFKCLEELEEIKAMADGTDGPLFLAAYTDTIGRNSYNDKLAQRRAFAVARALRASNPPILNPLVLGWYGESRSTDSGNRSAKDTASNRKVEVTNIRPKTFVEAASLDDSQQLSAAQTSQIRCKSVLPVKK